MFVYLRIMSYWSVEDVEYLLKICLKSYSVICINQLSFKICHQGNNYNYSSTDIMCWLSPVMNTVTGDWAQNFQNLNIVLDSL